MLQNTHLRWGGCASKGIIILGLIPRRPASVDMLSSDSWPKKRARWKPANQMLWACIWFSTSTLNCVARVPLHPLIMAESRCRHGRQLGKNAWRGVKCCAWQRTKKQQQTQNNWCDDAVFSFPVCRQHPTGSTGTNRGMSCAAAAGAGCSPGRCRPAWCPGTCGGWASPSWPGWAPATCPWAWAPAARGGSTSRAASGLWSCPCTCGSRWTTWRRLASCRRRPAKEEEEEDEEVITDTYSHTGWSSVSFLLTFSGGMWCGACTGRPPPPPRLWWRRPRRWWWRWPGCDSRCCLRPLIYLERRGGGRKRENR